MNLIYIVAEAFSPVAVDPILTPTLHKLVNNGFVFNNFILQFIIQAQVMVSMLPLLAFFLKKVFGVCPGHIILVFPMPLVMSFLI